MALTEVIRISEKNKDTLDSMKQFESTTYDDVLTVLIEKAKKFDCIG